MDKQGWVRIYRKSLDHWLYTENRPHTRREAWEDMLLMCNHSEIKQLVNGELIECNRGQSIMSLKSWAKTFKWSIQQVRTFFSLLEKDGMINKEGLAKTTRITICNYERYQDNQQIYNTQSNIQTTHTQQTDNKQITTNNNDKELKNEKNSLFRQRFFSVLEIFYFKNFKNPVAVTNAFFNHYEGVGWKNARGLDIENVESVAENWDNKTTEGTNCPENLLIKWKVMFNIIRNNSEKYQQFLLIRPAKLENGTLFIRGKSKDIENIEYDEDLLKIWQNALFITFGKVAILYEIDKQHVV
ncbi:MAG: hypothetical protein JXP36_19020 [Bacteroidales bacterium]|nr:hypothetical protein [Bacteroidales bacterium]